MQIAVRPNGEIQIPAGTTGKAWGKKLEENREKIQKLKAKAQRTKQVLVTKL